MFKLVRFLVSACALGALVWVAVALPLGKHTLWGHFQRIWATEAAQDLVEGAEESAGPAVERVKRGVQAGVREASRGGGGGSRGLAERGGDPPLIDASPISAPRSP